MISINISKVYFVNKFQVIVDFVVTCKACVKVDACKIDGRFLTNLHVACGGCGDSKSIELIPTIMKTCKEVWALEKDIFDEVMKQLENYKK